MTSMNKIWMIGWRQCRLTLFDSMFKVEQYCILDSFCVGGQGPTHSGTSQAIMRTCHWREALRCWRCICCFCLSSVANSLDVVLWYFRLLQHYIIIATTATPDIAWLDLKALSTFRWTQLCVRYYYITAKAKGRCNNLHCILIPWFLC